MTSKHSEPPILGKEALTMIQKHKLHRRKVIEWSAGHANDLEGPHLFYSYKVKRVQCYQMLYSNVRSHLNNSHVMLIYGMVEPFHILQAPSVLFQIKCFRVHVLEDLVRQTDQQNTPT